MRVSPDIGSENLLLHHFLSFPHGTLAPTPHSRIGAPTRLFFLKMRGSNSGGAPIRGGLQFKRKITIFFGRDEGGGGRVGWVVVVVVGGLVGVGELRVGDT